MNKLTASQVQNILFTAILAVAAVALYLFAGRGASAPEYVSASPAPSTPSPSIVDAVDDNTFQSVPEAVYLIQLLSNTDFRAKSTKGAAHSYDLVYHERETGSARLTYTLQGETVTSVSLTFTMFPKPVSKPKTKDEIQAAKDYELLVAAQNEALQVLVPAVFSACDLNDLLMEPVLEAWYTDALNARDNEKRYMDSYAGCSFKAYPSKEGSKDVIVCSLLLP